MNLQTKKLTKLSICDCGYSVLLDSIRIGTEYVMDLDTIRSGFFYRCGQCGTVQPNVRIVYAEVRTQPSQNYQPLPCDLFGI